MNAEEYRHRLDRVEARKRDYYRHLEEMRFEHDNWANLFSDVIFNEHTGTTDDPATRLAHEIRECHRHGIYLYDLVDEILIEETITTNDCTYEEAKQDVDSWKTLRDHRLTMATLRETTP
ncbi:hypothetical protein [Auritidibacter ignavus]|uniref:hypothetical protein n=1 Tax=Auritidibacter ignavus TaxID=678932 RepID=UPI000F023352|nr:hypothetical protein [Auritidibacter ignavus]NIH70508.1 hypothetical protein [Auritidibacter ignavus]RMX23303.1 hypothetical protein DYI20_05405 [Auritidibacter ignavus]